MVAADVVMKTRTCRRCGSEFRAMNGGRGQWPRFCSDACKETAPAARPTSVCTVADCDKTARTPAAQWCEMHYYRFRRRGTLTARPWHRRGRCAVEGCGGSERCFGYCARHEARFRRHGSPDIVLEPVPRRGPEHGSWLGDAAGYEAVHSRLVVRYGKAKDHQCVDCGGRAAHWSYDRGDDREKQSPRGPFTHNLDAYSPRCVSCHKRLDLDYISRTGARDAVVV